MDSIFANINSLVNASMQNIARQQKIDKILFKFYALGVCLFIIQVILGGITRLTGSGLSITSWEIVTGSLPPLSEAAWQASFLSYKQTPQYALINSHFNLEDFKFIYFWEWIHRFWARCIGVVAIIFMIYLWRKKYLTKAVLNEIGILFVVGIIQGLIGWIMVKSGLEGDAIYVKPSKLAIHFILAIGLISAVWIMALKHFLQYNKIVVNYSSSSKYWTYVLLLMTVIQLGLGCFMAGTKAASTVSTWPSLNGMWIPNFSISTSANYKTLLHFLHRSTAYILVGLTLYWVFKNLKTKLTHNPVWIWIPLFIVIVQTLLGIASVLVSPHIIPNAWGAFEWFAQLHQIVAIVLTLHLVSILYLLYNNHTSDKLRGL